MKFSCLQENLFAGLNINSKIAGNSRTSLPVLNNILLTTQEGSLKMSTTNLEMAIETKVRAKIEQEGQITVPAQLLTNYISLLSENEVLHFETVKDELNIKSKNQKTKIKGKPAEEFPIIPHIDGKDKYVIKSDLLKNTLEKTIFAISSTEVRVELSGALFSFNTPKADRLTIVGTDSYRLAEREIPIKKAPNNNKRNIIIPVKTLQEVLRILKEKGDVEICLSENQVLFIYRETEIISRIISGEFPNYKSTIPESFKTKAHINKEDFLTAVKGASFFARLGVNDINLKFLSKDNRLIVSSLNNQLGENETTLPIEITGENNEIVFNYHYLIDGLTNVSGREVGLEIVNDNMPGIIRSTADEFYLYLVMPIKNA